MNKIIAFLLLFFVNASYADFFEVVHKTCGGQELAKKNGERVFLDMDEGMIGLGQTLSSGIRIVDFNSVVSTGFSNILMGSSVQTNSEYSVEAVSAVRRTSLNQDQHPLAQTSFKMALIIGNELTLTEHEECFDGVLEYQLRK